MSTTFIPLAFNKMSQCGKVLSFFVSVPPRRCLAIRASPGGIALIVVASVGITIVIVTDTIIDAFSLVAGNVCSCTVQLLVKIGPWSSSPLRHGDRCDFLRGSIHITWISQYHYHVIVFIWLWDFDLNTYLCINKKDIFHCIRKDASYRSRLSDSTSIACDVPNGLALESHNKFVLLFRNAKVNFCELATEDFSFQFFSLQNLRLTY